MPGDARGRVGARAGASARASEERSSGPVAERAARPPIVRRAPVVLVNRPALPPSISAPSQTPAPLPTAILPDAPLFLLNFFAFPATRRFAFSLCSCAASATAPSPRPRRHYCRPACIPYLPASPPLPHPSVPPACAVYFLSTWIITFPLLRTVYHLPASISYTIIKNNIALATHLIASMHLEQLKLFLRMK